MTATLSAKLIDIMQAEHLACDQLLEHLQTISLSLAEGYSEHLAKYLQHEAELLTQLDQLSQQKNVLLTQFGYSPDSPGLQTAIAACQSEALSSLWLALKQKLQDCQQRNRNNAVVVKQSQRQVQAALDSLRGETNATPAYTASGDTASRTSQRKLGQA